MSTARLSRVTAVVLALAIVLTLVMMFDPGALGMTDEGVSMAYADAIFDRDEMMTVEITLPQEDWQGLLDNAQAEEYIPCDITVNGVTAYEVGIRCKGNSSLRQAGSSQRYSFKVQFDEYVRDQTLLGLDKIVLNNTQGDATWMKEYLAYYTMDMIGVNVPLYAFAQIYVNGEFWGLYLAVEVLEESYALRNYGNDYGHLYKVESMDMGNTESFDFQALMPEGGMPEDFTMPEGFTLPEGFSMDEGFGPSEGFSMDEGFGPSEGFSAEEGFGPSEGFSADEGSAPPEGFAAPEGAALSENPAPDTGSAPPDTAPAQEETQPQTQARANRGQGGGGMFMMGMGSGGGADLNYIDDSIDSYDSIFTKTVFSKTTDRDKQRVVSALEGIADEARDIAEVVDVDQMLRYIAGNAAVGNSDGYFGSMLHNYYLYEEDGKITMLPWDYNLAYGGFGGGASLINLSIDVPFSSATLESRPIVGRLLEDEAYKAVYYEYIEQIGVFYAEGGAQALIDRLDAMIREWVELDPTKAYTLAQYDDAVPMLKEYVALRGQSMLNQLAGDTTPVDTSAINLSAMGTMGGGGMGGGGMGGGWGGQDGGQRVMMQPDRGQASAEASSDTNAGAQAAARDWGGWPGNTDTQAAGQGTSTENLWFLGICAGSILLALGIAKVFRRRKRYA